MKRVAVFASGTGTNFTNLIEQNDINADFCLLVVDKEDAKVIERAKHKNINTVVIPRKNYDKRSEFEQVIINSLENENIDIIVLAGFMRILSKEFVQKYEGRIINIHPSLLPLYKGATAIEDAFLDGKNIFGVTVHYVIPDIDSGEIIMQEKVLGTEGLTLLEVTEKVHELEYKLYPMALKSILNK